MLALDLLDGLPPQLQEAKRLICNATSSEDHCLPPAQPPEHHLVLYHQQAQFSISIASNQKQPPELSLSQSINRVMIGRWNPSCLQQYARNLSMYTTVLPRMRTWCKHCRRTRARSAVAWFRCRLSVIASGPVFDSVEPGFTVADRISVPGVVAGFSDMGSDCWRASSAVGACSVGGDASLVAPAA